ncbi:Bicarbonate transporter BicA [Paenibacillus plantiphilus]|uniref:Bicarbonate transporter BicA n=1 Tax=Paenibacillus plantiphilus TaxID=2905650 RepID=A0ABN8GJ09_9BACL|nr:SulP family inorganic anion transporter [Paenibacillus plantiphilus]CAH1206361.1 Bicarbonate transporter BicA [Paenibacillus plantiphilus]
MIHKLRETWLSNIRLDVLAGITATLALIPDAIAFSFIAGVNPMIGIYSSVCILILLAFFGARPAMLSSAAGSMAVLMTALVAQQGIEYLFAATILTGVLQFLMGVFKLGRWMRFVPHAVVIGFINALAILILISQFKHFEGASWEMYALIAVTLAVIYLLPRLTKAIPSPLVAVAAVTIFCIASGWNVSTVGDIAIITSALPEFHLPLVDMSWSTFAIIFPVALSLAFVGYTETLLTQDIIDDMTRTKTDKNKEMRGQGAANFVTGFFGGMAGCALIAESVINVKLGGRGRLSNLTAGVFLLLLVLVFGKLVSIIPIAALVGVMLYIVVEILDWKYVARMHKIPRSEAVIMLVTAAVSVITHDLAKGVLVGVAMSFFVFVYHAATKIQIHHRQNGSKRTYEVQGQLFFGSAEELNQSIAYDDEAEHIVIDLTKAHVWDHSARLALNSIKERFESEGKQVQIRYSNVS